MQASQMQLQKAHLIFLMRFRVSARRMATLKGTLLLPSEYETIIQRAFSIKNSIFGVLTHIFEARTILILVGSLALISQIRYS